MQFEIPCPNGHNVRFSLKLAGRLCQCPKCSAKIPIPSLDELRESMGDQVDEEIQQAFDEAYENQKKLLAAIKEKQRQAAASSASSPEGLAPPAVSVVAPAMSVVAPAEEKSDQETEELIEFACPNGHQLSAPLSQAGKTGKCPHCQTRFIVPESEEVEEVSESEGNSFLDLGFGDPPPSLAPSLHAVTPPKVAVPPAAPAGNDSKKPDISRSSSQSNSPQAFLFPGLAINSTGDAIDFGLEAVAESVPALMKTDPMAQLFWQFWQRRNDNTIIELHTDDGRVFIPEEFFEDESRGEVGVFKVQSSNAHSVTIGIRWSTICRIQEKGA